MTWDEERTARAALTAVCEAGSPELARMVADHGARGAWDALRTSRRDSRWVRRAHDLDLGQLVSVAASHGVRFVVPGDREWPGDALAALDQAEVSGLGGQPIGLWLRGPGQLADWAAESVAIVGSRASSPYGERVAADLAIDLAGQAGYAVVSGGAYGIDGAAHRGAVAAGGQTIAVLAGGLDEPYPRGNGQLFATLAESQLLVSEVPCGMHPTRVAFLARNRLIAALSGGTVVVEAALRSGANNTASWALECGRLLMAVPGPVHSSLSATPHRLIRDQKATLVTGHEDVTALLAPVGVGRSSAPGGPARLFDEIDPALMAVREVLPGRGGLDTGEVARRAGISLPRALASLGQLQQMQLVRSDGTGRWRICTPSARSTVT